MERAGNKLKEAEPCLRACQRQAGVYSTPRFQGKWALHNTCSAFFLFVLRAIVLSLKSFCQIILWGERCFFINVFFFSPSWLQYVSLGLHFASTAELSAGTAGFTNASSSAIIPSEHPSSPGQVHLVTYQQDI